MTEVVSAIASAARQAFPRPPLVVLLALAAGLGVPCRADETSLRRATEFMARGAVAEATRVLEAHLADNPNDPHGYRLLGLTLALIPKRTASLEALSRAVGLEPSDAANHLALGQALARFGEHDAAADTYRKAIALDPTLYEAHQGLGLLAALRGDLDGAVRSFTSALEHAPPDDAIRSHLHLLRGRASRQADDRPAALRDFMTSTQLNADYGPSQLALGTLQMELGEGHDPSAALTAAAHLMPRSADAFLAIGMWQLETGQAEAAIASLRKARHLGSDSRSTVYALGRALRMAGRHDEARAALRTLSGATPDRAEDEALLQQAGQLNNEALAHERAGEYDEALKKYRAAIRLVPSEIGFRRNAALALCRLERWQEAKVELRSILRIQPGDLDATKALYVALEHAPDP